MTLTEPSRSAIVPHIRTLDAIHLASALRTGVDDLVVVTHDDTMRGVAEQIGFRALDPVSEPGYLK